jgi:hypothetical protein
MSVVYKKDNVVITAGGAFIAAGKPASVALADPENYAKPVPGRDEIQGKIAKWGTNNQLPQEMTADIEATGVLSAGIDAKVRIAIGKGPMPARIIGTTDDGYEQLEFITDNSTVNDFLEENNAFDYCYATGKDLFATGNPFTQVLLNHNRSRLLGFKRIDPCLCRFAEIDEHTSRIANVYLSGDWSRYSNAGEAKDAHYASVPLLDRDFPLWDLMSRTKGNTFMLSLQYPLLGRSYYAPAPWYAAKKWVKIAQGVPEMKEAMFRNQMTIKYVIEIHDEFWPALDPSYSGADDKAKKKIKDDFYDKVDKYLVGGENAYKSLWSTMVFDKNLGQLVPALKITALDDKIKDGKLLPDSAAANIEILLPLMINAALLGVDMPGGSAYGGGAGSGSNIREAFLVQVMLVELERRKLSIPFNIAKRLNGWDKDLVLRFPNQILTTLNTGKNTQSTA